MVALALDPWANTSDHNQQCLSISLTLVAMTLGQGTFFEASLYWQSVIGKNGSNRNSGFTCLGSLGCHAALGGKASTAIVDIARIFTMTLGQGTFLEARLYCQSVIDKNGCNRGSGFTCLGSLGCHAA